MPADARIPHSQAAAGPVGRPDRVGVRRYALTVIGLFGAERRTDCSADQDL
jgi:hypothetical protein